MRVFKLVFAGIAALSVAACAGGGDVDLSGSPYASGTAVLQLTSDSAGPITASTPYSKSSLESLFPGFRFDTVQTMSEGKVRWLMSGFDQDGLQAIQIEAASGGRSISRVHVVGPAASGPRGERIGMTYRETGGGRMSCEAGRGDWTGMAICSRSGTPIEFVYAPEQFIGQSGQLPRGEELSGARLVRMIWSA
ncbi:MAG: DUF1131 family protein [Pseudomonadota bacterium]